MKDGFYQHWSDMLMFTVGFTLLVTSVSAQTPTAPMPICQRLETEPALTEQAKLIYDGRFDTNDKKLGNPRGRVWSPQGQYIAAIYPYRNQVNGIVLVWDVATSQIVSALNHPVATPVSLAWSPDGTRLATSSDGVRIWDIREAEVILHLTGAWGNIVWSANSEQVATIALNLTVWDAISGAMVKTITPTGRIPDLLAIWPETGLQWLTETETGQLQVWRAAANTEELLFTLDTNFAIARLSPQGRFLTVFENDTTPTTDIWNISTKQLQVSLPAVGLSWSPDEQCVAGFNSDDLAPASERGVRFWDVETGEQIGARQEIVAGLTFSPDGTMLAATDDVGGLTIWRVPQGE